MFFSCSPHILGGSKPTVLLVYVPVNSKMTMHHTRIWLTGKFNTPAHGKIEMVQCRDMHLGPGPAIALRGYSWSKVSCFNLSIIPSVPSNCRAFVSTFERQRDFIHLPIEGLAGCLPQKWLRSAGHLLRFASRKTKIPAIPQAPRRHGYKLLVHNTSQSEYYKGAARPVLGWRKANVGLGHVTRKYSVKPPQTRKLWQSSIDTYRWIFIASATQTRVATVYS